MTTRYLATIGPNTFEIPNIDDWRALNELITVASTGGVVDEHWFDTSVGTIWVHTGVLRCSYVHTEGEPPLMP